MQVAHSTLQNRAHLLDLQRAPRGARGLTRLILIASPVGGNTSDTIGFSEAAVALVRGSIKLRTLTLAVNKTTSMHCHAPITLIPSHTSFPGTAEIAQMALSGAL